jgi:hypothetical protein
MLTTHSPKTLADRLGPIRQRRSLHLIDAENLLATPTFDCENVEALKTAYSSIVPIGSNDHVVIASSHHSAIALRGWSNARPKWRSGPDGADLALIDVITGERVTDRFMNVVIGSGDGIFADTAIMLQQNGLNLTIVSRPESLSNKLTATVTDIRYLPLITIPVTDTQLAESA